MLREFYKLYKIVVVLKYHMLYNIYYFYKFIYFNTIL
jgi:hypothetical protein